MICHELCCGACDSTGLHSTGLILERYVLHSTVQCSRSRVQNVRSDNAADCAAEAEVPNVTGGAESSARSSRLVSSGESTAQVIDDRSDGRLHEQTSWRHGLPLCYLNARVCVLSELNATTIELMCSSRLCCVCVTQKHRGWRRGGRRPHDLLKGMIREMNISDKE